MSARTHDAAQLIRFYGLRSSLAKWRVLVNKRTGKKCSPLITDKDGRNFFDVGLTAADRETLMAGWYAESGTGNAATGRPWRWNDCVTVEVKS